jgi:hypothetical protein
MSINLLLKYFSGDLKSGRAAASARIKNVEIQKQEEIVCALHEKVNLHYLTDYCFCLFYFNNISFCSTTPLNMRLINVRES